MRLSARLLEALAWLPELLGDFRLQHPSIVLKLRDVVPDRCLEFVLNGQADLCVNSQPGNELEYESSFLFHERYYVVCRRDDPLAVAAEINVRKLQGRDYIRTTSVWRQLQPVLTRAGVRDTGLEVEQFGTVAGLVLAGFGIGVVPQLAALCVRPGIVAARDQGACGGATAVPGEASEPDPVAGCGCPMGARGAAKR